MIQKLQFYYKQMQWFLCQVWTLWKMKQCMLFLMHEKPTIMLQPFQVGEKVHDDLTGEECTIIGIEFAEGQTRPETKHNNPQMRCWGIYLDSSHLHGARHPWEITPLS